MKFTKINAAEILSSEGFKIKLGRESLTYILLGGKRRYVTIPIEDLGDPYELLIRLPLMSDWLENGRVAERLSKEDSALIVERINLALNHMELKFKFECNDMSL